jgi:hypothetical protein
LFNLQGLTAAAAVLGLSGLAANAAKFSPSASLGIALGAGFVMLLAIAASFELIASMEHDATVNIQDAVGQIATVYLGIPANREGVGKITLTLQQQSMEFAAATEQDKPLAAGEKVIVIAVNDPALMQVVSAEKYLRDIEP